MVGLILAAGKGSRISSITKGEPKSFLQLGGKRLIDHQIQALIQYDIEQIVIIVGYRSDLMEEEYSHRNITIVKNPFYDITNVLASVWFAKDYLRDGFYFMHADTFFNPEILKNLIEVEGKVVLAVNKKDTIPEDMKVHVEGNSIREISKEMDCEIAYGEFIGLAKISPEIAPKLIDIVERKIEYEGDIGDFFESAIQDLVYTGINVKCYDIGDRVAIEIDYPEDYDEAKSLLNKAI